MLKWLFSSVLKKRKPKKRSYEFSDELFHILINHMPSTISVALLSCTCKRGRDAAMADWESQFAEARTFVIGRFFLWKTVESRSDIIELYKRPYSTVVLRWGDGGAVKFHVSDEVNF